MDKHLERVIFSYLHSQDFIVTGNDTSLFFHNSESEELAQIRFDKEDGWCYIYYKLIEEISSFFSLQRSESKQVIGRWVENTLQMKVTNTALPEKYFWSKVGNTPN